jgi:4-hydroxy-2-oxoglutarate aldolase
MECMDTLSLNGIFPPVPTPFVRDEIAADKLAANIEKWSRTGLHGLVVAGSNGEYVSLSERERRDVVKAAVAAAPGDLPVIAGTGCESTRETIRLTNDCAALGARAALVVTPHYYGGRMTPDALKAHFTKVADEADIPVLIYSVPKFTHIHLSLDLIAELSRHPNIIGIKDSAGNLNFIGELINRVDDGFKVLVGTAGVLFGGISLGCAGGICALANVAPGPCVAILEAVRAGDFDRARRLQLRMLPVNNAVTSIYGVPGLKAALDMLGYFGGDPRPPLRRARVKEKLILKDILRQAELLVADA